MKPDLQIISDGEINPKDAHSFGQAYELYFPRVYNYIRYRISEPAVADDLTSITFHKALDHLARFDSERASFSTWLLVIARNSVNDHLRKTGRRRLSLKLWWRPQTTSEMNPEKIMIVDEERDSLLAAIARLSARERDILGLKFAAGKTHRSIAAVVGQSESNIGVIVHRAMEKLRVELTNQEASQ